MNHPFLNVSESLKGVRWNAAPFDERAVTRMMQHYGLAEIVARLLAARSIAPEAATEFLSPTLKDHFPNPFSLKGMEALAEDLSEKIIHKEPLAIFGDFDVDGATSSAILVRFFRACGLNVPVYIPDRMSEGYGPNVMAFAKLKADGAKTVILADCGTTAHMVIEAGRNMGLELVILDHHEPESDLAPAHHLINPKQAGDVSGLSMLAACGVCFLTCVAINKKLKEKDYYPKNGLSEPDLKQLLDLVALGTVCDMVPLTGANRLLVRAGMAFLNKRQNLGIAALCDTAKITKDISIMDLGFSIGPRINAGSRVHRSDLGAKLLATENAQEALDLAWALHDCNERRKEMQKEMMQLAEERVKTLALHQHPVIVVDLPEGYSGLAGLVAGRLKDKYGKPACVVTYEEATDGTREARGSGRSVKGISMADLFQAARQKDILLKGGGHAMAGGFTLLPERLDDFRAFIADYVHTLDTILPGIPDLIIDGLITVQGATTRAIKMLEQEVGPFGQGHEPPRFAMANVCVHQPKRVGNGSHIMCQISDMEGGVRIKGVAFGIADDPLGQAILNSNGAPLHLAGSLKVDTWQGNERAEFHIEDGIMAAAARGHTIQAA